MFRLGHLFLLGEISGPTKEKAARKAQRIDARVLGNRLSVFGGFRCPHVWLRMGVDPDRDSPPSARAPASQF
jgi:hypothetical protein